MINAKVNKGTTLLDVSGDLATIAAEFCVLAKRIVNGIRESDERAAKRFVEMLTDDDELIKTALNSGLDDDLLTRKQEELTGKMCKRLDELKDELAKLEKLKKELEDAADEMQ